MDEIIFILAEQEAEGTASERAAAFRELRRIAAEYRQARLAAEYAADRAYHRRVDIPAYCGEEAAAILACI